MTPPPSTPPTLTLVEGCIGAGKSTVLAALEQDNTASPRLTVLHEPVEQWAPYLAAFYRAASAASDADADPDPDAATAWAAFELQMEVLRTRADQLHAATAAAAADADGGPLLLSERSVQSSVAVFGRVLAEQGRLPAAGPLRGMYARWADSVARWAPVQPARVVFIDTPPDVCAARIVARARGAERAGIPAAYLRALSAAYEDWLATGLPASVAGCAVLRVDGTRPVAEQAATVRAWLTVDRR